jgi:hypothetical protein
MEKLVKDGKVAVLVSPGFGAGWSSWLYGEYLYDPLFDPVLAQMLLDQVPFEELLKVAEERYPDGYLGGLDDVQVTWLPVGTKFRVNEYDGAESLELESDVEWAVA